MPLNQDDIARKTQTDTELIKIHSFVMSGWPENCSDRIKAYSNKRLLLSVENDCLFYGHRIIIPKSLHNSVLKMLHDTHIGMTRMKLLAKRHVWWFGIDEDIEKFTRHCEACQLNQDTPSKIELASWLETKHFFERIHIDFYEYNDAVFLITVDTYSRWIDVQRMTNTKAQNVIEKLRTMFTYYGLPKAMVSDNGPPFDSKAISSFCKNNNIKKLNSPPYHPQSNGWAERAVRTIKKNLKKMACDKSTQHIPMALKIQNFLLKYRNTPHSITGVTPNDRIFTYRPRTLLSTLNEKPKFKPSDTPKEEQQATQRRQTEKKKSMDFKKDETVLCKAEGNKHVKWMKAVVVSKESKLTYKIKLQSGRIRLCHGDQLRKFYKEDLPIAIPQQNTQTTTETGNSWLELPFQSPNTSTASSQQPQTPDNNTTQNEEEFHTPPTSTRKLRPKGNVKYYEPRPRKIKRKKKQQTTVMNRSLNLSSF